MDWIEEKISLMSHKIRKLPFRSAVTAYILVFSVATIILSYITITFCCHFQSRLWNQYNGNDDMWIYSIKLTAWSLWPETYENFTMHDRTLMRILDTVRVWSPFVYGVAGAITACLAFYRRRLKTPLEILKKGTCQVKENNLDFDLSYDSKDEMGELCHSFDEMRRELIHNKEMMWELLENQKQLNAAFAHDLRTPLTVLKGYSDFLARYLPQGKVSGEKMLDTLRLMSDHLNRLEQYSRTMKGVRSLDELPVQKENYTLKRLEDEIQEIIFALNQIGDVRISFLSSEKEKFGKMKADGNLILEVLENLLSNSIRFADSNIYVTLSYENQDGLLYLVVSDDGPGFTEHDFQNALLPYYREHGPKETEKEENPHFGIGLHICRQLTLKHGGELSIANSIDGGAVVTASFYCKNE